ncbi:MAG TPA: ABC-2 family transporter protein [Candidatus Latescibacteria bacterium]|jgi:ABC-2 type transport system permease protein|nr:ABC-2 family transporter protein [Candidatus Latescibacterota bacterium]
MAADAPITPWDGESSGAATHWPVQLLRRFYVQAYLDLMFMTRDIRFFLICALSDVVGTLSRVAAVFLLAERFDGIGIWSHEQILFMLGYATLVNGLLDMFFGYNILGISRRLGRGQLDHSLVQPQPLWMTLLTEGFTPVIGLFPVLAGVAITGWAMAGVAFPADPLWWVYFITQLVSSCLIVVSFSFLWGTLAFWSPVGAEEISSRVNRMARQLTVFPLDSLSPWLTQVALLTLPLGFVVWYPSRVLLGLPGASPWSAPAFAAGILLSTAFVFSRGLRHHERTGSQRYVPFGHRR